jgi:hypothetical protein
VLRDVVPREWPKKLFSASAEAWADLIATGEALALARDMLSFMQQRLWPAKDTRDYNFLEDWEAAFSLQQKGDEDKRTDRVIANLRQRGTMTQDLVKTIMCRAWGVDDPSRVGLESASPSAVWTEGPDEEWQWAKALSEMYIYDSTEAAMPDEDLIQDLIAKNKPTFETWYYGQYRLLKWYAGGQGTWNYATWG